MKSREKSLTTTTTMDFLVENPENHPNLTKEIIEENGVEHIPPHIVVMIQQFLGSEESTLDLREPHLRTSIIDIYPFILFMYCVLIAVGVFFNSSVFVHIVRNRLYREDATYSFIINNVISDLVKCVVILPLTLYVLLVENWMLGELLCSFLPMLQDIPLHTTTLTFLLMAWDRLRYVRNPSKPRLPAFVCTIGSWLTSVCLVLPYPIYIIYVDLGKHVPSLEGVGICLINLADDMQEYMRGIFLVMYAGPLAFISYLYVRVSRELQTCQGSLAVILFESRGKPDGAGAGGGGGGGGGHRSRTDSHSTATDFRGSRGEYDRSSQYSRNSYNRDQDNGSQIARARYHHHTYDTDLDLAKEKRTQKYLVPMVTLYAICLCPLMILRLARLALLETYDNSAHFDITYTTFVWIAFLPTCTTPIIYVLWQMSRSSKERLRGYFRFSNRSKLRQSCETVITAAGTPAPATRAASAAAKCQMSTESANMMHHTQDLEGDEGRFSDNTSFQQDFSSS